MSDENLPREIGRGVIRFGDGGELEVIHLSDGQRIIDADTLDRFCCFLANLNPRDAADIVDEVING